MKEILKLKNPIMIDGKEVAEVSYDSNEIDGILFATAESKRKAATGTSSKSVAQMAEFDYSLHLYMGYAAIIAVNPTFDFSDVERIKGRDAVEVMAIGRNFILKSEEAQPENDSDVPTEITHESTTRARQSSKERE